MDGGQFISKHKGVSCRVLNREFIWSDIFYKHSGYHIQNTLDQSGMNKQENKLNYYRDQVKRC